MTLAHRIHRRLAAVLLLATSAVAVTGVPAHARTPVSQVFTELPGEPWSINEPATVAGGVLTLGPYGYVALREGQPNEWNGSADNSLGWTVETSMRLDPSVETDCTQEPARLWAGDYSSVTIVGFGKGAVCLTYPELITVPMDTQDDFHTYRLDVRASSVKLWVDGRQVIDHTLTWAGGGTATVMVESLQGTSHWRYLSFDTTVSLPACTITGTAGADRLTGGPGADVICGGDGDDELIGRGGDDVLLGGLGQDTLTGGDGDDIMVGGQGDDLLDGGRGSDRQYGTEGDDRFVSAAVPGGDGGDVLSGGFGSDTADYSARRAGSDLVVTLDQLADDGVRGENDRVGVTVWDVAESPEAGTDVERVVGGAGADTLTGDRWDNQLVGGPGADQLSGMDGWDFLDGADGQPGDSLDGGDGTDECVSDEGDTVVSCNDPDPCYYSREGSGTRSGPAVRPDTSDSGLAEQHRRLPRSHISQRTMG